MVDIHSHILPGVDDGASSFEMAEQMCRAAAADGITHMVATPHANHEFLYDRVAHQQRLDELQAALGDTIKLSLGCDFHCSFDNLNAVMDDPSQFTIAGTNYLLVEFSDYSVPPSIVRSVLDLLAYSITPIITHPERNLVLQKRPEHVLEMVQGGCLVQVTANSVTGFWGRQAKKCVQWLLDREAVHVVATDCHNLKSRPPVLSQARADLASMASRDLADALAIHNPAAIVAGRPLA